MPTTTYFPIATYTVPSNIHTVTFSSLGSGWTDLVIQIHALIPVGAAGDDWYMRINGTGGTSYSRQYMTGYTTSSTKTGRTTDGQAYQIGFGQIGMTPNSAAAMTVNIQNASSSVVFKEILSQGSALNETCVVCGTARITSPVTSISFNGDANFNTANNWLAAGSMFTIYGIATY